MLLSILFPIADSRGFIKDSGRLLKPGWPIPTPDQEFIRNYGAIRVRPRGGIKGWVGEDIICEATRSIKLCDCHKLNCIESLYGTPLRVAYRRYFFDGLATGKFELGLSNKSRTRAMLFKSDLKALLNKFLHQKVRIRQINNTFEECILGLAGKYLSKSYLDATTTIGYSKEPENWWVRSGIPILFLEYDRNDQIPIPYCYKEFPNIKYDFSLYQCRVPFNGGFIQMWILNNKYCLDIESGITDAVRTLRMCLLRLHSEHECLRLILRNIMDNKINIEPRSDQSNLLQIYFNEATRRIGLQERKTDDIFDEIPEIARASMNLINPGQQEVIKSILKQFDFRKNIFNKIENYINNKWGNITIIRNAKEIYMGDVFRDINGSIIATRDSIAQGVIQLNNSGNEEIAKAISDLDNLIAKTPDKVLPPEKKQECLDLLKGITEETKKQQPSKGILRSLGEGLLTILTTVGSVAQASKSAFDVLKSLWS